MTLAHGYTLYVYGCRCDICRGAMRDYQRDYRQRPEAKARSAAQRAKRLAALLAKVET